MARLFLVLEGGETPGIPELAVGLPSQPDFTFPEAQAAKGVCLFLSAGQDGSVVLVFVVVFF